MSEKEQVLERLDEIQSSLMDSEKFMPYNYNILILWGFVSAILYLTFENISNYGAAYSSIYIMSIIIFTVFIEKFYTKKENLKYDLKKYTKTQKFIESLYMFSSIFASIMTYVFVVNNIGIYSYFLWMFMIALTNYIVGFILNNKYFTLVGLINISLVYAMLTISFIFTIDIFTTYLKYIAVIFSSFGCIYIGIKSKKEF